MKNIPSKKIVWAQIVLIFILPVLLIYFDIIPSSLRIAVLAISSLFIYGIIRHEHWTFEDMGIRHDNIKKALPFYIFFTIFGLMVLLLTYSKIEIPKDIYNKAFYLNTFIFFLPSCFFQEFAFRSFLMPRLKIIFRDDYLVVLFNALIFTFMHIIYFNLGVVLPLVFVAGILLALLYLKYPNLILISFSHSVLNIVAVLLGFFIIS